MKVNWNRKIRTILGVMAALPLFSALPLLGQSADVSDAKLEAVAKAYVQVLDIQNTYKPKIESARTQEEAQRLQQEANQKMIEAIQVQQLAVEEYNAIINASDQDAELRERLVAHIQRVQAESSG
jgi:hypothetical protein